MEYLYHVDENDHVLGYLERTSVHIPPYPIHRATSIITLTPDYQILFQRRAYWKNVYPGAIDIHGGNVQYIHVPKIITETVLERKHLYEVSMSVEFLEEVGLDIPLYHFHWVVAHPLDYFKVRIPNVNYENKVIFLVFLSWKNMQEIDKKNSELKELWTKVYSIVSEKLGITPELLLYKVVQKNEESIRINIRECLINLVGIENIAFFEIEEFMKMPWNCAMEEYRRHPENFADGFYSLFDSTRNMAVEAKDYSTIIQEAMEKLWQQKSLNK